MATVDFSVKMRSRSVLELENMHEYDLPQICLRPIRPTEAENLGLPEGTLWVWAIVQPRKGLPDALLFGGASDSMSGAEAMAREEFHKREIEWAAGRGLVTL